MPASHVSDASALRTGLSHAALGLAAFLTLTGGAVGASLLLGSEEAGGPRIELSLYSEQNGPPPSLKNRLTLETIDAGVAAAPDLGIEYADLEEAAPGEGALTMTVTEIASNAGPGAASLPRAPVAGFFERTASGDLPKIGPDGRRRLVQRTAALFRVRRGRRMPFAGPEPQLPRQARLAQVHSSPCQRPPDPGR